MAGHEPECQSRNMLGMFFANTIRYMHPIKTSRFFVRKVATSRDAERQKHDFNDEQKVAVHSLIERFVSAFQRT